MECFRTTGMLLPNKTNLAQTSIRQHLIPLVLVAVLPILLFAGGLIAYLAHEESKDLAPNLKIILMFAVFTSILVMSLAIYLGRNILNSFLKESQTLAISVESASLEKNRTENTIRTLYEISTSIA
ncbi:MAG: hypothetical protein H0V66_13150, partial [Bdellovibrionales bacterium]|nr:hypothetical protein [Bdellovibrionales bacterium]